MKPVRKIINYVLIFLLPVNFVSYSKNSEIVNVEIDEDDYLKQFQDTTLLKSIPENYFLDDLNESSIINHFKRIKEEKKKNENIKQPNFLKKLILKEIDFKTFLIRFHNQKIEQSSELFLFKTEMVFSKVHKYLSQNEEESQVQRNIKHEREHFIIAKKHGIEIYYGIRVNIIDRNKKETNFRITATVFPLIEKKAFKENWSLKKYINVSKECLQVSKMSPGDLKSLKSLEAIEKNHKL